MIWGERHLITWHGKARKLVSRPRYGTGKRARLFRHKDLQRTVDLHKCQRCDIRLPSLTSAVEAWSMPTVRRMASSGMSCTKASPSLTRMGFWGRSAIRGTCSGTSIHPSGDSSGLPTHPKRQISMTWHPSTYHEHVIRVIMAKA